MSIVLFIIMALLSYGFIGIQVHAVAVTRRDMRRIRTSHKSAIATYPATGLRR